MVWRGSTEKMKRYSWVDGDRVQTLQWECGLSFYNMPSQSRFFRVKESVIHLFVWTMEVCYLYMKEGCWWSSNFWGVIHALVDSPSLSPCIGFSPSLPHLHIWIFPHFCCGVEFLSLCGCARIHLDEFGIIDIYSHKSCVLVKWLDVWVSCFTPF